MFDDPYQILYSMSDWVFRNCVVRNSEVLLYTVGTKKSLSITN